jgi:hypothetical protein
MGAIVDLVTRMKLHEPRWIDTAHRSARNDSSPGQVLSGVRHAAYVLASGINGVGVNVESTVASICKDEVALPRVDLGLLMESASGHQAAQERHLPMRYGDVQIVVASSLVSEQRVYGPTTVDIDLKPALFEEVEQFNDA